MTFGIVVEGLLHVVDLLRVAFTVMKTSSVTPPLMTSVPWSTHFESIRMPPNNESDTANGGDAGDGHQHVAA